VTLNSQNIEREAKDAQAIKAARIANGASSWQTRNSGREHVALGMLTDVRTIRTKKGDEMAFAKLQDYGGAIDITIFPRTWETIKSRIFEDGIYAFRGKVDVNNDAASFIVDSLEDPASLEARAVSEVHIAVEDGFADAAEINPLKDFLFGKSGQCIFSYRYRQRPVHRQSEFAAHRIVGFRPYRRIERAALRQRRMDCIKIVRGCTW